MSEEDATTSDWENITTNLTTTLAPKKELNRTEFIVLTCVVAPLSFFGNMLILICFMKEKKLRFFGNYFLISLAISDMISGVVVAGNYSFLVRQLKICGVSFGKSQTPNTVYADYALTDIWRWGHEVCLIIMVIDYTITMCSSWTLSLISLDKLWGIVFPVNYQMKSTISLAMKLLVIPWMTSFCTWGLPILLWNPISGEDYGSSDECGVPFKDTRGFLVFLDVMNFYIPFMVIAISNILIFVVVVKRSNKLSLSFFKDLTKVRKQKLDVKSARALALLVLVFLITWAPNQIVSILDPICDGCVSTTVLWISYYLVWFNSAVNPFLYPIMQKQMRETMISIFCCGRKQNQISPFTIDSVKAKRIIVQGYEQAKEGKGAIPIFMNAKATLKNTEYISHKDAIEKQKELKKVPKETKTKPVEKVKEPSKQKPVEKVKEQIKEKPAENVKELVALPDPSKPSYLQNYARVQKVGPAPTKRSKHLSRKLPSGPTKKRSRLLKKTEKSRKAKEKSLDADDDEEED